MGYRLGIERADVIFYGTKLYGYEDYKDFDSYKWLLKNYYIDEDYDFITQTKPFVIKGHDLKIFLKLYYKDLIKYRGQNYADEFMFNDDIISIMKGTDYTNYIVDWS